MSVFVGSITDMGFTYAPPPTPRVPTLAVPCGTCGAEVGQKCLNASGTAHIGRKRIATRTFVNAHQARQAGVSGSVLAR